MADVTRSLRNTFLDNIQYYHTWFNSNIIITIILNTNIAMYCTDYRCIKVNYNYKWRLYNLMSQKTKH